MLTMVLEDESLHLPQELPSFVGSQVAIFQHHGAVVRIWECHCHGHGTSKVDYPIAKGQVIGFIFSYLLVI